jgi:ribosomal protein L40E
MNFRTFGKFGFLLAIFGFFMPVACDKNAFQLIEYLDTSSTVLIIGLFILAIIGFIIGLILLTKNNVPTSVDWIITLGCIGIGLGLLSKNELELQYGAYVIITGIIVALIAQIISAIIHEDTNAGNTYQRTPSQRSPSNFTGNDKKCRKCGKIFSGAYTGCPHCGSSLYEETRERTTPSSPIINVGNTWICKKCGEENSINSTSCKGCGEYR